ncbi:MAG: ABC transporter permease [Spirochaetales bacterium]|nr:ABC transporter permease [Spirochaetales bacterium]
MELNAKKILKDQRILMLLVLIVMNLLFGLTSPAFFSKYNFFNMFRQAATIVIVASAGTLLMMTGNIDLSTGSTVAFAGVLYALFGSVYKLPLPVAGAIAVLGGALFGVVNGLLVARYKFQSFIATLGTMYIGQGVALVACNGQSIRENMPANWSKLARGSFIGLPIPLILMVFFLVLFIVVARKTLLGKYSMAIGGNKNAAFFSGINDSAIIFWLYVMVGALAGFAGVMTASRIGAGDPRVGKGFEFDIIIAILLGGTDINGGKGSVIGMFIGAMIITVLGNGLSMLDILPFWQQIFKGVIVVVAIILNEYFSKKKHSMKLAEQNIAA